MTMLRKSSNWRIRTDLVCAAKTWESSQAAIDAVTQRWGDRRRVNSIWRKHVKPQYLALRA